jgi:hypothetical protein
MMDRGRGSRALTAKSAKPKYSLVIEIFVFYSQF